MNTTDTADSVMTMPVIAVVTWVHPLGGPSFVSKYPQVAYAYFLLAGSAALVGVAGNLLVLGAICVNKQLHQSSNAFLFNLALADLYVTGFADPFGIFGEYLVHQNNI